MDRRHRRILSLRLGVGILIASPLFAGTLVGAPDATPAASASATPWVQASPPPGMTATPKPADPPHPPAPAKTPAVSVPLATPSQEEMMREMMHRRAVEKSAAEKADKDEARQAAEAKHQPPAKPDKPEGKEARRLDQLPPDEREAYERNLPLWRQMPEEERDALRQRADERAKQETDKAYQESGLTLDHDEREVFDLRYRQERRKLERELQDRANAERTRRLAEISDRLKHEFVGRSGGYASPTPAAPRTEKDDAQARGHAARRASRRDAAAGVHALEGRNRR